MSEIRDERCAICHCHLHRRPGTYARHDPEGRSHATAHHYVAERFFGRSKNRPGTQTDALFKACPWDVESRSAIFCYECHEELLHNPVLLPEDIAAFAKLVAERGFSEEQKSEDRSRLAGRVKLLHEVIAAGLQAISAKKSNGA